MTEPHYLLAGSVVFLVFAHTARVSGRPRRVGGAEADSPNVYGAAPTAAAVTRPRFAGPCTHGGRSRPLRGVVQ